LVTEKSQSHKSPDIDQILAELIKAGGRTIRYAIHTLIICIWNKKELPEEGKESIIVPIYIYIYIYIYIRRAKKQTVAIIEACHFYQLHTKFYPASCSLG